MRVMGSRDRSENIGYVMTNNQILAALVVTFLAEIVFMTWILT